MSMSQTKKEFFEGIQVSYNDYRQNPAHSRKLRNMILEKDGKIWFKKHYPITIRAMKEFIWGFRDTKITGITTYRPKIDFLDGEIREHSTCNFYIEKNEKTLTIFMNSCGQIDVLSDGVRKEYKAKTCKEFILLVKQIRKEFEI